MSRNVQKQRENTYQEKSMISEVPDSPLLPDPVMSQTVMSQTIVSQEKTIVSAAVDATTPKVSKTIGSNLAINPNVTSPVVTAAEKAKQEAASKRERHLKGPLIGEVESKSYFKCCFNRMH